MASNISLTVKNIQEILDAFDHFFPPGVIYSNDKPYGSISGEFVWDNKKDFIKFVSKLTGIQVTEKDTKAIKEAQIRIQKLAEEPAPDKPDQIEATTPGKEQLEYLSQKAEEAKLKTAATQAKVTQQSQEQLQKLQKLAAENIYLKAEEIKVPELDQATINDFQARVTEAKKNPTAYNKKLAQEIYEGNKVKVATEQLEQLEVTSKIVAINLTEKLVGIDPTETLPVQAALLYSQNPIHALASLSNPNDPELIKLIPDEAQRFEFCKAAQNLALVQGHDNILTRNLLSKILPEQTIKLLYPEADNLLQFSVSTKQEGSHHIVNRQRLIESYQRTSPFLDNLQSDAKSYALKFADKSLSNLPWYSKTKGLFGRANISIAGSSLSYESGMLSFFSSKGIPLLAPDLARMLASQQFSNIAVSSALNFRMGTFAFSRAILSEGGNMVGQAMGVNLGNYAIRLTTIVGEGGLKIALNIGTKAAVEGATKLGAQAAISTTLATTLSATFGSFAPVIGHAIGFVVGWLVGKVGEALINFIKKNKDFFKYAGLAMLAAGGFLGLWPLAAFGGLMFLGALGLGGLAAAGTSLATAGVRTLGFFGSVAISISTTAVIIMLSFPVVVALILFIINSGAYIVPPKVVGTAIINIPPGGNLTKCDPNTTGADITQKLASSINSASVYLLPNSISSRQDGICMDPTMIVLHTSGGYDNDDGNTATYGTLVQRDLSCQMATDTNDTILMLSFFEKQVEYSWCADNLNAGGISTEMAGECQGGCAPVAKCSPSTSLTYQPNGPHPCPNLEDLSFDAVCKIMKQYKIPWSQVFQHEASNGTHTDPIGDAWVDKFIVRLKNNCPV